MVVPNKRLRGLVVILIGLLCVFTLSGRWRQRIQRETTRYRRVAAALKTADVKQRAAHQEEERLKMEISADPDDVEPRLQLGRHYLQLRAYPTALDVLGGARSGSEDARVLRARAECYRLLGREDKTLALLDRAAHIAPGDGNIFADRAMLLSLLLRFREAESDLQRAEREGNHSSQIAFVRGTMAWQRTNYKKARAVFTDALRMDPDNMLITRQLSSVALSEHKEDEAAALLEKLAKTHPDNDVLISLCGVYLLRRDPPSASKAIRLARLILARTPDHPRARLQLGVGLHLTGATSEAEKILEQLYHEYPRMKGVAYELAQVYQSQHKDAKELLDVHRADRNHSQAMRRAALLVVGQPDNARAHFELAKQCMIQELYGRAVASFERARELDSSLPGVSQQLSIARKQADRSFAAKTKDRALASSTR